MYDYSEVYTYGVDSATGSDALNGVMAGMGTTVIIGSLIGLFMIICMWKMFSKAGKPGVASIVPIWNVLVMIQIAGLEWWYLILLLIPIVNIFAIFKIYIGIAQNFGKSSGFGVAMIFFSIICMPILAFGSAEYVGD